MAQPLTPWVALEDVLRVYAPELIDPATGDVTTDPDKADEVVMWQRAIDEATWAMWALSGGRIHAAENWVEDYSLMGSCEVTPLNGPLQVVLAAEMVHSCGHLVASPPVPAHPIWPPQPLHPLEFCVDYQRINFCCSGVPRPWHLRHCGGCNEKWVRIYYRTESTLPPGTEGRVAWLADQYVKAVTGDKACQLPDRIQSVSRQGVSWTMLDPMDFLDKKMTGIGRLDSWLSTVRLVYPASQLIDPLRSQRRNSYRIIGDGGDMAKNEVLVSTEKPADPEVELWYDPDATPGSGDIPVTTEAEMEKVS